MLDQLSEKLDLLREIAAKETLVVAGAAKSGTTWLQRMLNTHPEIYCPGEGKFREFALGFVNAANDYNKHVVYTNQVVYKEGGSFYRPWGDDNIAAGIQFLIALSWATSTHGKDLSRVRYIGDKDTQYADNIEVWRDQVFKDARFIHLIRDGRDSAVSIAFHKKRAGNFDEADFHKFVESYARGWANRVRIMREAFASCPERYHEVRYEDLLSEPASYLGNILGFLGVEATPELIARIVEENSFRKLSGGRESGEENQDSFYRKGVAGDWQTHFDEQARRIFSDASGGMLADLGYDT
ncbi:MAG: hypothetical protein GC138_06770 [Gammaproteobacteria bacterium]|nr:hypothetical protein [Gammaproteobacteria bacterium]